MKKFLAVLLAVLMIFSVTTVAFATDEEPTEETTTVVAEEETTEEEGIDFTGLPIWSILLGLKLGGIFAKIILAFVGVFAALGLVDMSELFQGIADSIQNGNLGGGDVTTTEAPVETTLATA